MSSIKTTSTKNDSKDFIDNLENEAQRADCMVLFDMMHRITKAEPVLWSHGTVGFGSFDYKGKTTSGSWYKTGFAPRKNNLSIHVFYGFDKNPDVMERLGKHKTGKSCLYVNKLADIDLDVLEEIITEAYVNFKGFDA